MGDGRREREDRKGEMPGRIKSVRDLVVYRKAFDAAMEIFELSKSFPREELYSLTDQIRRSSRSVCTNLLQLLRRRKHANNSH
jgi:hypothetical protein